MKAAVLAAVVLLAAACSPPPGEVMFRVGPPTETSAAVYTLHVRTGAGTDPDVIGVTVDEYEACYVGSIWPECAERAR